MIVIFRVLISQGCNPDDLLSDEVLKETKARIMTLEQASAMGLEGLPQSPADMVVRFVLVAHSEAGFIQSRLEGNPSVSLIEMSELAE